MCLFSCLPSRITLHLVLNVVGRVVAIDASHPSKVAWWHTNRESDDFCHSVVHRDQALGMIHRRHFRPQYRNICPNNVLLI